MAVFLSPVGGAGAQFFDNNGNPLTGGKLYTYAAGTTTPQTAYTTSAGNVAHANPIVFDAAGRVPGSSEIWLTDSVSYKFVLYTSANVLIATWDNISGINDVNAQFVNYTPDVSSLFSGQVTTVKQALDNVSDEETGSQWVGFLQTGNGAVARTQESKNKDLIGVKDFGAVGNDSADDYDAFNAACTDHNDIRVPAGTYVIGQQKLGEYQKPLNIVGEGADVIVRIGPTNVDKKAFRVGAVGSPFGGYTQERAVTKFESLTFKTPTGILAPWSYTGIDVAATFPIVMKDITMLSMGPDSIKMTSCFYGYVQGFSLVNSGLTLNDVNVIEFSGGDIRASDSSIDPTRGGLLFGDVGKYPVQMTESDLVKFTGTVFEAWKVPVIRLVRCYTTVFNGSWFEGNDSISHVIKTEQAQTIEFNSCQLDFAIPYADCFIKVNNQIPNADQNRFWTMFIRINGGLLQTTSIGFGDAKEFVKVTAGEEVRVLIDGLTFLAGPLYADKSVQFDVRSILLTSESKHNFYSLPNATLLPAYNRWMPKSVSADWDFSTGANFTATAGLVVATTTANGEYMTGTRAVEVSNIANDSAQKTISRTTTGEMGAVTIEGQSYYVFVRLKCDQEVILRCEINGGFLDFAQTPTDNVLVANTWRDYVFKTDAAVTWAQGRFFTPTIKIYVTNPAANPAAANLYIDRIDYSIVRGDVQI
jgi:hypothetical protein